MKEWVRINKWFVVSLALIGFILFAAGSISEIFANTQEYFIKDGLAGKAGWSSPVISEDMMSFWAKKVNDTAGIVTVGNNINAAINAYELIYPEREIEEIYAEVSLKYR